MYVIPREQNGDFVAAMENVLGIYHRPLDVRFPVVCMDEQPVQLIGETQVPIPARSGRPYLFDYEYRRAGTTNIFMLRGNRSEHPRVHDSRLREKPEADCPNLWARKLVREAPEARLD
jgi:hypothetical protein